MTVDSKKILIAEDNPGLARVLSFKFSTAGYETIVCGDGQQAWEAFQANEDLVAVLSDHEMPLLTGVELFELIRQSNQSVTLFLITGRQLELSQTQLSQRLNISEIIGKPFSPGVLLTTLETSLGRTDPSRPVAPVEIRTNLINRGAVSTEATR